MGNEPSHRNLYNIFLSGIGDPPDSRPADVPTIVGPVDAQYQDKLDDFNERRTRGVHTNLKQGKNMVWTMVALSAEDQLRQRVAWALSQIFVVSDKSMKWNHIEVWMAYYDIFVRHAFGSYREVMREVAYR